MCRIFLLATSFIFFHTISQGQEAKAPKSLYRILTEISGPISDLTFSTNGSNLAFSNNGNIYIIAINETAATQLNTSTFAEDQPQWSPDGSQIVYRKDSAGLTSIWIYEIGTGQRKRITGRKENAFNPSWQPNGKAIAYSTDTYGSVDVAIKEFDTDKERRLTAAKGDEYIFGFHPNGKFVGYYERNTAEEDIYAISLTGKEEYPMTRSTIKEMDPKWSYDGSRAVFRVNQGDNYTIYTAEFPYGELLKVGQSGVEDISPIVSAKAEYVIYPWNTEGGLDLLLYDIKRKETSKLGLTEIENLGQPVWSIGGRILALSSYDVTNDQSKIWLVNISQFIKSR